MEGLGALSDPTAPWTPIPEFVKCFFFGFEWILVGLDRFEKGPESVYGDWFMGVGIFSLD